MKLMVGTPIKIAMQPLQDTFEILCSVYKDSKFFLIIKSTKVVIMLFFSKIMTRNAQKLLKNTNPAHGSSTMTFCC